MKKLLSILLTPALYGAVSCDQGAGTLPCSAHPAIYTVTCAATTCTSGELANLQSAVDDAQRGDTIKVQAGRVFVHSTATDPAIWLDRVPAGSSGRVVITTTEEDKLPASDARITPAYKPLMPEFRIHFTSTSGVGPFFAVSNATEGNNRTAAQHWELKGLSFWAITNDAFVGGSTGSFATRNSSGFIRIGSSGFAWGNVGNAFSVTDIVVSGNVATLTFSASHGIRAGQSLQIEGLTGSSAPINGTYTAIAAPTTTTVTVPVVIADGTYTQTTQRVLIPGYHSDLADDIVVDRCLFQQDGLTQMRRAIYVNSKGATIKNSYITSARDTGSADSQMIGGLMGAGPLVVENNFLSGGASENIMFGGDYTTVGPFEDVTIRYNYFSHDPLATRQRTWSVLKADADPLILKGRTVLPTVSTGYTYIALNTGQLGATEPTWCTTSVCQVTDGTVTWQRFQVSGTAAWSLKNLLETKGVDGIVITHNVFEKKWAATQDTSINFKTENQSLVGNPTFQNNCPPSLTSIVDTNGTTVTKVSGDFPMIATAASLTVTINGVAYTTTAASLANGTTLTLTSDAGVQSGVTMTYGSNPTTRFCQYGETRNVLFAHNVIRNVAKPINVFAGTQGKLDSSGDIYIRHNWIAADPATWTNSSGSAYSATTSSFFASPSLMRTEFSNNTVTSVNTTWGMYPENDSASTGAQGDMTILNNIFTRHSSGAVRSSHTSLTTLPMGLCSLDTVSCPTSRWHKNIFAGATLTSYTPSTGDVYNLCGNTNPKTTGCGSPDYTLLFKDYTNGDLRVKGTSVFKRASTTGADYGADMSLLPLIKDLSVTPSDRMVMFAYRLNKPIAHIPCVVELSASADYSSYAGELGTPSTYYREDTDANDRFPQSGRKRFIVIGHTANLTASTLYYYRLHCGGDVQAGTFTTEAAKSGTGSFGVSEAGAAAMTWGYSYSRATDTISGGGSGTCVSSTCTASGITKGRVFWYRVGTRPVKSMIIQ